MSRSAVARETSSARACCFVSAPSFGKTTAQAAPRKTTARPLQPRQTATPHAAPARSEPASAPAPAVRDAPSRPAAYQSRLSAPATGGVWLFRGYRTPARSVVIVVTAMRRVLPALFVIPVLAFLAAGCGGGGALSLDP